MMGIWLPYPNVRANIDVLNDSHVADVVWQGLDCLRSIPESGRRSGRHVRMWQHNPGSLLLYVVAAEAELRERGVGEEPRVRKVFTWYGRIGISLAPVPPWWYGDPAFHRAQRSHLIRCEPEHYARRLPLDTPLELDLIWPEEGRINAVQHKSSMGHGSESRPMVQGGSGNETPGGTGDSRRHVRRTARGSHR